MVDFATQTRQYGYRFNTPDKREPAANRHIYRETTVTVFSTPRAPAHDCRELVVKQNTESNAWGSWLLSTGLRHTYEGTTALHHVDKSPREGKQNKPDKLLYTVGQRGSKKEHFLFPRDIAILSSGDIFIADSGNHRIQRINQCGVYVSSFGVRGTGPGQFRNPASVATLENSDIVVVDRGNRRIQILAEDGVYKCEFSTVHDPFFVRVDASDNIVVSTVTGWIEIYQEPGTLVSRFKISGIQDQACPIAVTNRDEVIIVNAESGTIQQHSYSGKLTYTFSPVSLNDGMACQMSGVCVNQHGQVVVCDALNHMVNVYSERGSLVEQLAVPADGAGAVQAVATGPEGHLVVTEYTTNGPHCVKIFRYNECECHKTRPGSAKKQTK